MSCAALLKNSPQNELRRKKDELTIYFSFVEVQKDFTAIKSYGCTQESTVTFTFSSINFGQ